VATAAGPSNYRLWHSYDDVAAIQKTVASAERQAAVADVQTFATGGVDIFMFDTRPV
jgi:quinol monooxygenase YgiN